MSSVDDVWANADDIDVDADCSPTKVCRNAREFTFEGIADQVGDGGTDREGLDPNLATSWRKLLEREGKLRTDGDSLRDLVLGPNSSD